MMRKWPWPGSRRHNRSFNQPRMDRFAKAVFVKSADMISGYPVDGRPHFPVIGRSNSGKSSLINALCGQNKLAKTSAKPGRTRLVNFFLINEKFYLVDLPGYGYIKGNVQMQAALTDMINSYFTNVKTIETVLYLLDIRRDPDEREQQFLGFLERQDINYLLILTKADKLKPAQQRKAREKAKTSLFMKNGEVLVFSKDSRESRIALLKYFFSQKSGKSPKKQPGFA